MRHLRRQARWLRSWSRCLGGLAVVLFYSARVEAQPGGSDAISFDEARIRLTAESDALAGARANTLSKKSLSTATRYLRLPEITLDIREQHYKKTLDLPFGSLAPVAAEFGLTVPLRFVEEKWTFRPLVIASWPLYTGGQISAAQDSAAASVREAKAEHDVTSQLLLVQLVQAYFGQQLAARALAVRKDVRDGLQQHLDNAVALEREGFATTADQLQATVARDRAEREYQNALTGLDTSQALLANLLHSDRPVATTTELFVIAEPLPDVEQFQREALSSHPQLARLRAVSDRSKQGVRVQQATFKPQIFTFGTYDFYKTDAQLTDPDWAVGIGLRYTLLSRDGRPERLSAARHQVAQADAGVREARRQLEIGVIAAYNDLENARRQYLLLDSAIAHAQESLRLQELSFREGLATSLDVIDARLALGQSQIERANAAYQYDLRLAQLLAASGQVDRYTEYVRRGDRRLEQ